MITIRLADGEFARDNPYGISISSGTLKSPFVSQVINDFRTSTKLDDNTGKVIDYIVELDNKIEFVLDILEQIAKQNDAIIELADQRSKRGKSGKPIRRALARR